jgi:hypothetical protein
VEAGLRDRQLVGSQHFICTRVRGLIESICGGMTMSRSPRKGEEEKGKGKCLRLCMGEMYLPYQGW